MYFIAAILFVLAATPVLCTAWLDPGKPTHEPIRRLQTRLDTGRVKPKIFILSTFLNEAEAWRGIPEFDVFAQNISVPGLSPLFPNAHCVANGDICQVTTGEGEINAAISVSSLLASPKFDLTNTYFLVAGIASINPKQGTLGSVAFARYAIQVGLQHEIDAREISSQMTTGFIPQGSKSSDEFPHFIFGTEVFELNSALRTEAVRLANQAYLNDSDEAIVYRGNYQTKENVYNPGCSPPTVIECDVVTSDTWFSGSKLGDAFENYAKLVTAGGVYCAAAQEDNAILAALLRGSAMQLVDFGRIIVMRTGSDFDRPYPEQGVTENLFWNDTARSTPAIQNIYIAGIEVINGILSNWTRTYEKGIKPINYIGDILGSLGSRAPFLPEDRVISPSSAGKGGRGM